MVRKYKKNRLFNNAFVICFAAVISLGLMGLCYGAWYDNLFMDISIAMGFIEPEFELIQKTIEGYDGCLTLSLSDDNKSLFIDGWCYPSFKADIPVRIINRGSISVKPYIKSENNGYKEKGTSAPNSAINAYIKHLPQELEGGSSQVVTIQFKANDLLKDHLPQVQEDSTDSLNFDIQSFIEKLKQEEEHAFAFELQFEQLN